jgi:putative ABC transport system permease protein
LSATPWLLARRHPRVHWVRSTLTVLAMALSFFLLCLLISLLTTLKAAVSQASSERLFMQSSVSLYVDLPRDYLPKIRSTTGVADVTPFQWFGGYYQEPANFLAEFGVDPDAFFPMYERELRIVEGPGGATGEAARAAAIPAFKADRRACLIGADLARDPKFGWRVGDTVPIIGTIFQKTDRTAWEFNVVGVYEPLKSNVDGRTIWFRHDYLLEMLDAGQATGPDGIGAFAIQKEPGTDAAAVIAALDSQFTNGPQRTLTSTEAAFQASFVSMMGNVPRFVGMVGGAIVVAVFFAVINAMLLAGRQRIGETGILKALGFRDGAIARAMLGEAAILTALGAILGLLLTKGTEAGLRAGFGTYLPNYHVTGRTLAIGCGALAAVGLLSSIAPALLLARLRAQEALRHEG